MNKEVVKIPNEQQAHFELLYGAGGILNYYEVKETNHALMGEILTLMEAVIVDKKQLESTKDLIRGMFARTIVVVKNDGNKKVEKLYKLLELEPPVEVEVEE